MNIITVNVGQGALAIVRHQKEAIIVDCQIPASGDDTVAYVKEMLALALKGHNVKGLILTGFDSDHSEIAGASIVLKKYRPDWVMYPKYYKDTDEARRVFALINDEVKTRRLSDWPLDRISVRVDQLASRRLTGLSDKFDFELFSPHIEDMDSSNNCSIVLKLTGRGNGGFSYLITGDTETPRWETINRLFGSALKSHVLAAPHHGSKNATHPASLLNIAPHTVLISAGVDSQYGHPHPQAVRVYSHVAKHVFSTNMEGGVSLLTQPGPTELTTTLIRSVNADAA
jgi:beta-lactamase superfamily II metal-dependent hydrolase